jgi:hypothetical protein
MSISKKDAIRALWFRGVLHHKLHDYQKPIYDLIQSSQGLKFVLNCSRRFGKTFILSLIAIEFALKNPNSQIRFAAPTQKSLKNIILPMFTDILKDCPESIRPVYKISDGKYVFSNGSEIHVAGTDNGNAERLRGTRADLAIVDEAGFCSDLDYVVQSILLPQTLTTGGKVIIISTPARTPAHDFTKLAIDAEQAGSYAVRTIYDNKSLTPELIEKYAKESGGINSSTFKREYLCEFTVDEESQIIPEFKDEYIKDITKDEFYSMYHKYVAMDMGVVDKTALLFGYYDFKRAALVVEDELDADGSMRTTETWAEIIKAKEKELWQTQKPYRRIADNNSPQMLIDMGSMHGLHFMPTNKESLNAMINQVRMMVNAGRLIISPKCEMLIGCLKYGVWNNDKSAFDRSKTYGHFDHLAALVYLIRNLDESTNPVRNTFGMTQHSHYIPENTSQTKIQSEIKKLFKLK